MSSFTSEVLEYYQFPEIGAKTAVEVIYQNMNACLILTSSGNLFTPIWLDLHTRSLFSRGLYKSISFKDNRDPYTYLCTLHHDVTQDGRAKFSKEDFAREVQEYLGVPSLLLFHESASIRDLFKQQIEKEESSFKKDI